MSQKILIAALLAVATVFILKSTNLHSSHPMITRDEAEIYEAFNNWMVKFGKEYPTEVERQYRFKRFSDNYVIVTLHNLRFSKGLEQYNMELNHFADLDRTEFKARHTGYKGKSVTKACTGKVTPVPNPPPGVDWTTKGVVTPVKNQGQCGSCWAFSTTGSLEGLAALEKGKLPSLSEQQLVDCAGGDYGNQGCNGGYMDAAMWYVIDNGITDETTYPYRAKNQKCSYKDTQKVYQIKNCAEITPNKTASLMEAVASQPVAIAIEADQVGFQLYKSGVFNGKCGTNLDHGVLFIFMKVLLVGYGTLNTSTYWKVKNSWGATWGSSGYILIAKGGDGPGLCGIQMENAVPLQSA